MSKIFSKRRLLLLLGVIAGLSALIIDNGLSGGKLALAQMILWTVIVFAFVALEVAKSLLRPRQLCVALALVTLHVICVLKFRHFFPLDNMLVGFIGIALEAVILIFLYARIGQSIDPQGPFGLSEAESNARRIRRTRPM
jgi:hypothetical protein